MKNIQIGDRVRNLVTYSVPGGDVPAGTEGVVIRMTDGLCDVEWESPVNTSWVQIVEELETIE